MAKESQDKPETGLDHLRGWPAHTLDDRDQASYTSLVTFRNGDAYADTIPEKIDMQRIRIDIRCNTDWQGYY
jgi:hypothetical protein